MSEVDERNHWTTLSSQEIYDNPWIKIVEDQVINPAGGNGIYGKVLMKNKAIGIVPLDENDHTWLVGQYRYTLNEFLWEIPKGGGPDGEHAADTARRELQEETGLIAGKLTCLLRIHTSDCVTDEEGFIFLAEDLSPGEMNWEPTEKLYLRKLPFAEALAMALDGRITDAMSLAGILKLAAMRCHC